MKNIKIYRMTITEEVITREKQDDGLILMHSQGRKTTHEQEIKAGSLKKIIKVANGL